MEQPLDPAISPGVAYRDAPAAIKWQTEVLGFRVTSLYEAPDGTIPYAQLAWRDGAINLSTRNDSGRQPPPGTASIVLTAEDAAEVDRYYERAKAAGADIVLPLEDAFYGSHGFSVRDPEGNQWHFGTPWHGSEVSRNLPERQI